jgi:hypothetical protein
MKYIVTLIIALIASPQLFGQGLATFTGLPGVDYSRVNATIDGPGILGRTASGRGRIQKIGTTNITDLIHLYSGQSALTDGSTNTLFTLALATNTNAGLTFTSTVIGNGTNRQSRTALVQVEAINEAGTITTTVTQSGSTNGAFSTGLLATTYLATGSGGNSVLIRVAADSSLTFSNFIARWNLVTPVQTDGTGVITTP